MYKNQLSSAFSDDASSFSQYCNRLRAWWMMITGHGSPACRCCLALLTSFRYASMTVCSAVRGSVRSSALMR